MRRRIKHHLLKLAYSNVPVFDILKRVSRMCGRRTKLYKILKDFAKKNPTARIIQIGANDGVANDPLREHILRSNWKCVLVEPVPYVFAKLKKNYKGYERVLCVNAAIGGAAAEFYYLNEDALALLPRWASQLGSFSREHIQKHFPGRNLDGLIQAKNIKTLKINDLIDMADMKSADLVHLDVEGYEAALIDAMLADRILPKLLLYESAHLGVNRPDVESKLRAEGYELQDHGMDTLAVSGGLE